jgi:hypothetical protein
MSQQQPIERPIVITVLCACFLLSAAYLWVVAMILILDPGQISVFVASRLMHGLELAGPYMILLVGSAYGLIGWGLFRLRKWARWLALLVIALSIGSLVPVISAAQLNVRFYTAGLEIALCAACGFYLMQSSVVLDAFARSSKQKPRPQIDSHPQE